MNFDKPARSSSRLKKRPRRRIYAPGSRGQRWNHHATWISAVIAAATVVVTGLALGHPNHPLVTYFPLLVVAWAVVPPIWFWFEFYFLYLVDGEEGSEDLFKHGQQTAVAIWAGIALSLGGLAWSDRLKPPAAAVTHCCVCKDEPTQ